MFNIGTGEFTLIAVLALLILGPKHLPELARGLGKYLREFRRHTDEVRSVVEREFYKLDAPQDTFKPSSVENATPFAASPQKEVTPEASPPQAPATLPPEDAAHNAHKES